MGTRPGTPSAKRLEEIIEAIEGRELRIVILAEVVTFRPEFVSDGVHLTVEDHGQ